MEASTDHSKYPENGFQCFDGIEGIEIGNEFKTEFPGIKPTNSDFSNAPSNKIYSRKYCATCNKSWNISSKKRQNACSKCNSIFKFKCKKCKKIFSKDSSLSNHLKNFCNKQPRYRCEQCNHVTHYRYKLVEHIQAKHRLQNLFTCPHCQKNMAYAHGLKRHLQICGKSKSLKRSRLKNLQCDHCNYKTNNKELLAVHIQAKHLPRQPPSHECPGCLKKYASERGLKKHSRLCGLSKERNHPSMPYACDFCEHRSNYRYHLRRHMRVMHPTANLTISENNKNLENFIRKRVYNLCRTKLLYCDHCRFKTNKKSNLADHIFSKHFETPNSYECKNCRKTFSQIGSFTRHSKICVARLKRFSCDHCDYETSVKGSMVVHMQAKHLPRDPNSNRCDKCAKSFVNRGSLNYHRKRCALKWLHCDHCGYNSEKKRDLARHMQLEHLTQLVLLTNITVKRGVQKLEADNRYMLAWKLLDIIVGTKHSNG